MGELPDRTNESECEDIVPPVWEKMPSKVLWERNQGEFCPLRDRIPPLSKVGNAVAGKPNIQYVYSIATALGVTLDQLLQDAAPASRQRRRRSEELPPGLAELQQQLNLSDHEVETLAQINFRGNRPKDVEGWRFLLEALKMLGQRNPQR